MHNPPLEGVAVLAMFVTVGEVTVGRVDLIDRLIGAKVALQEHEVVVSKPEEADYESAAACRATSQRIASIRECIEDGQLKLAMGSQSQ